MAYTVKQLAAISGVTVRTLHFYDAAQLLKPAYHGANGYRFYERPQLLKLQQILFYRALGLGLKQIKTILERPDFDKVEALESHRRLLRKDLARTLRLIQTIDKTIEHLKGTTKMKDKELFVGLTAADQRRHEGYLVKRYGGDMKRCISESKKKVARWSKSDWEKSGAEFEKICSDLTRCMRWNLPPDSPDTQLVIRRHHQWIKQFWTPNRESYAGHGTLIVDSELAGAYRKHDPQLPEFAAAAMKVFAEAELS